MNEKEKSHICISCENSFTGNYCNNCGEKVLNPKERSLRHILGEIIDALTGANKKFWKSFLYLLFKPGLLTKEYLLGKRKKYMSPIGMFFFINLIYFIFQPADTLNTSFRSQVNQQAYSNLAMKQTVNKLNTTNLTFDEVEIKYDRLSKDISKIILIVLVFLYSIPSTLLFYNKDKQYFSHFIFSLHFFSFVILSFLIIIPGVLSLILWLTHSLAELSIIKKFDANSWPVTLAILISLLAYIFLSAVKTYQGNKILTFLKSLGLIILLFPIIIGYRFILFELVLLFI